MRVRTVLISGAGVAGPTLAYWLARHGFRVTVVERAGRLRSSGNPVDVRGPARDVAERMGVMPRLREAATGNTGLAFVNARGKIVGRMDMSAAQRAGEVELPRGDLASILYEAGRDDAEYLFDDSITALSQDGHGVEVTFERSEPRRFDVVVGADGLHSVTRRLAFGEHEAVVRHMGLYVATAPLDNGLAALGAGPAAHDSARAAHGGARATPGSAQATLGGGAGRRRDIVMYNVPGKAVAVSPTPHGAFFLYRAPAEPGFDHRDTEQHKRMLTAAFAGVGWRAPELLERVRAAGDLYFDSVSQVSLSRWSNGRVVLLGDAGSSVSLFGDGSTLAMAGAATLADELAASPDDPQAAFLRYERAHRRLVEPKQRGIGQAAALLAPATRGGILARNLAVRLWPVVSGVVTGRSFRPVPPSRGPASS